MEYGVGRALQEAWGEFNGFCKRFKHCFSLGKMVCVECCALHKIEVMFELFFFQKLVLCRLPKDELAKYLSCYLKLDFNNYFQFRERKRRNRLQPVSIVEGTYRAAGVVAPEVAIDNQVARVHMEQSGARGMQIGTNGVQKRFLFSN